MSSLLVTGGAGYIGSHTVKALKAIGHDVVVLDNLVYGHRELVEPLGVSVIEGDIGDRDLVPGLLRDANIDAVVHFAAYAYVGESVAEPSKYYQNNVVSTLGLLESMREANVDKIVFSSTCATYGVPDQVPITEAHPQRPINPYGATKMMVERLLGDFDHAYGMRSVSLRYFNAAGADPDGLVGEHHDPETHLIPLVLAAAAGHRSHISVFGDDYDSPDGTCIRDYIHVSDLADAHVLALDHLLAGGHTEVFNLGNGRGFSVLEVIEAARRVTGRPIEAVIEPRRPGDPDALVGSADRIRSQLGWEPKLDDLDTILATAWAWYQKRFGA